MSKRRTVDNSIVYHYTSVDTLKKIAQSGEMWASSALYLNDTKELDYFLDHVRARIPIVAEAQRLSGEDQQIFSHLLNAKDRGFEQMPFIISFSAHDDELSQWRAYCHAGNGVSIGFRSDCLSKASVRTGEIAIVPNGSMPVPTVQYYPVQYPSEDAHDFVDDWITKVLDAVRRLEFKSEVDQVLALLPKDLDGSNVEEVNKAVSDRVRTGYRALLFHFGMMSGLAPVYKDPSFPLRRNSTRGQPSPGQLSARPLSFSEEHIAAVHQGCYSEGQARLRGENLR